MPKKWIFQEGWTKYDRKTGKGVPVEYPEDDLLIFDIENCVVEGNFFRRSIFQTFWKVYCCTKVLFFELDTSNFGDLLIPLFCLTVQSFRKIGQHLN